MAQTKLYKLLKDPISEQVCSISKDDGGGQFTSIPINEENTDYQEYLEWVAEGNTAEAAD